MWKSQYPFESRWFKTPFAQRMHYIDVGSSFPVVMLHGNPTWSFMYRSLLAAAAQHGLRGIAPDHIGCGLSDKPQDWEYTLERHMTNLDALINDQLRLSHFDLVVHDWGGPIGLLYAVKHPEQIRKIVLMNTLGWVTNRFPRSIHLTRIPVIGALLVRSWNLLMRKALRSYRQKPIQGSTGRLQVSVQDLRRPHRDTKISPGHPAKRKTPQLQDIQIPERKPMQAEGQAYIHRMGKT